MWVASLSDSPKPPPNRITLTLPVLAEARNVVFVVTGNSKADALKTILANPGTGPALPSSRIKPRSGQVVWFLDAGAAEKLPAQVISTWLETKRP